MIDISVKLLNDFELRLLFSSYLVLLQYKYMYSKGEEKEGGRKSQEGREKARKCTGGVITAH